MIFNLGLFDFSGLSDNYGYWIGLAKNNDFNSIDFGNYQWADATALNYTNFGNDTLDCVHMSFYTPQNGQWDSDDCFDIHRHICELWLK